MFRSQRDSASAQLAAQLFDQVTSHRRSQEAVDPNVRFARKADIQSDMSQSLLATGAGSLCQQFFITRKADMPCCPAMCVPYQVYVSSFEVYALEFYRSDWAQLF